MRGGRAEHLGKLLESVPHLLFLGFRHLFRPFNVGNQVEGMFGVVRVSHDRPGGETNGAGPAATHLARLRLGFQPELAHDKGFGGQKGFRNEPHHGDTIHQGGKRNNRHNIRRYGSIGCIIVGAGEHERQHTARCHNTCGIHVFSSPYDGSSADSTVRPAYTNSAMRIPSDQVIGPTFSSGSDCPSW